MSEYKDKNSKDLIKTLVEKRDALEKFRFGSSGSRSKNVKEGYLLRKDIARIQTELTAQAHAAKAAAPAVKTVKPVKAAKATKKVAAKTK